MNIKDYKQAAEELKGFTEWSKQERYKQNNRMIISCLQRLPENTLGRILTNSIHAAMEAIDYINNKDFEGLETAMIQRARIGKELEVRYQLERLQGHLKKGVIPKYIPTSEDIGESVIINNRLKECGKH